MVRGGRTLRNRFSFGGFRNKGNKPIASDKQSTASSIETPIDSGPFPPQSDLEVSSFSVVFIPPEPFVSNTIPKVAPTPQEQTEPPIENLHSPNESLESAPAVTVPELITEGVPARATVPVTQKQDTPETIQIPSPFQGQNESKSSDFLGDQEVKEELPADSAWEEYPLDLQRSFTLAQWNFTNLVAEFSGDVSQVLQLTHSLNINPAILLCCQYRPFKERFLKELLAPAHQRLRTKIEENRLNPKEGFLEGEFLKKELLKLRSFYRDDWTDAFLRALPALPSMTENYLAKIQTMADKKPERKRELLNSLISLLKADPDKRTEAGSRLLSAMSGLGRETLFVGFLIFLKNFFKRLLCCGKPERSSGTHQAAVLLLKRLPGSSFSDASPIGTPIGQCLEESSSPQLRSSSLAPTLGSNT